MVDGKPWHCVQTLPMWKNEYLFNLPWINIYRAVDWGYDPDPAVCLWIASLPSGQAIVFKERTWKRTLASDVAQQIKQESEGMHIVETFCDPTMFIKTGNAPYSIGELFQKYDHGNDSQPMLGQLANQQGRPLMDVLQDEG